MTGTSVDALSGQLDKMKAKMGDTAPPIGQMGGLLVDLTEHGETGRAAMTALGSAFTGIVAPSKAVADAQKIMGVTFTNANGQLLPMKQIIGELSPALDRMGNAQAAATLKALGFGSASTKLVGVIQAGPAAFDKATAAVTRQNSAHEAAEKQAQNLQHQIELVKATVQDYGVKIGQALIPKLEALLKAGLAVSDWLGKHKGVLVAVARSSRGRRHRHRHLRGPDRREDGQVNRRGSTGGSETRQGPCRRGIGHRVHGVCLRQEHGEDGG